MQTNVQQVYVANAFSIFRHQKSRFKTLKAKGMLCLYCNITSGAVVHKQSTGNVNGNYLIAAFINMIDEAGGESFCRPVYTRAKQGVYYYILGRNGVQQFLRRNEADHGRGVVQAGQVGLKIFRAFMAKFKDVNSNCMMRL